MTGASVYVIGGDHVDGSGPLVWSDRTADAPGSLPGPVGLGGAVAGPNDAATLARGLAAAQPDPRLTMFRDLFPKAAASLVRALARDLVGGDAIAALLRP
jgi:hypothetical protein